MCRSTVLSSWLLQPRDAYSPVYSDPQQSALLPPGAPQMLSCVTYTMTHKQDSQRPFSYFYDALAEPQDSGSAQFGLYVPER